MGADPKSKVKSFFTGWVCFRVGASNEISGFTLWATLFMGTWTFFFCWLCLLIYSNLILSCILAMSSDESSLGAPVESPAAYYCFPPWVCLSLISWASSLSFKWLSWLQPSMIWRTWVIDGLFSGLGTRRMRMKSFILSEILEVLSASLGMK